MRSIYRLMTGALAAVLCLAAADSPAEWQPALDHISPRSLRGHLSFLASDLLEGRNTPSRGLDLAAEYIAAQFRRAGLAPAGDDGYFQTAKMVQIEPSLEDFHVTFQRGEQILTVNSRHVILRASKATDLPDAALFRAVGPVDSLDAAKVRGRIVVTDSFRSIRALRKLNPAAILQLGRPPDHPLFHQLVEAAEPLPACPVLILSDDEIVRTLRDLNPGPSDWRVSLHIGASHEMPVKVRNVIGVLPGSDPALKDTYVLLTAHYDHLGLAESGDDRVYNGANDDGSGTVSVIEIGAALAALPKHPRRSIVFMTFFGEEEGLLGSLYYARHPVFPLAKTVADINLEQIGRTDASEGPEISDATFTGYEYSDIPAVFQKAGQATGIKVYEAPNGDNEFFNRSDNLSFADHGIPAHTVVVAAEYPDYHAVGDEWQKIDYDNMARVDRMLALGTLMIADDPQPPKWNGEKAGKYSRLRP